MTRPLLPARGFRSRTLTAALVCGGAIACTGDASSTGEAPGRPAVSFDDAPVLTLAEEVRIGHRDDPDLGFSAVGATAVAPDGRVFVVEAQDLEIRVFSPDGERIGAMGRRGEGPGEFEAAPRIGVVGDTLWAFEPWVDRLTLFRTDGTLVHTRRMEIETIPLPNGAGALFPAGVDAEGRLVGALQGVRYIRDREGDVPQPDSVPWVAYDWEGQPVGVVGWQPAADPRISPPADLASEFRTIEVDGRRVMVPDPPPELEQWSHTGSGLFIVDASPAAAATGTFRAARLDLAGDTLWDREFPFTPVRWSDAELDSVAASHARGRGMMGGRPMPPPDNWRGIADRLRAEMRWPEFRSAVDYGWPDADGRLWLAASTSNDEASRRWVRLSASGEIEGSLELPRSTGLQWAAGDRLWVSERDDLGVPWIVVYRVGGS